jgi:hypothetical protein
VLGASMIIATLATGGILVARSQMRSAESANDADEARLCAQSGLELARLWISSDSSWRTNRSSGNWVSSLAIGNGTVSIDGVDLLDGNFTNRPHDPVQLTVTARKGMARRILTQTLVANPTPMPALRYAIHAVGQIRVESGYRLILGAGTLSTNGELRNDGTVEGSADAGSCSSNNQMYGTLTTGVAARAIPASTVPEAYASLGTLINTPSTLSGVVLSPSVNPYGVPNPDGVYVIRSSNDITIKNCRIYGTLVVISPGRRLTLTGANLIQPSRPDFPALIVNGDCDFAFNSSTPLGEASVGVNFNPAGAAYQGMTDTDQTDFYPNEIQGLVHITGTLSIDQPCTVRGAILCESSANSRAVDINADGVRIYYDSGLYTNPPQFYTTSVQMLTQAGSYKPVVN